MFILLECKYNELQFGIEISFFEVSKQKRCIAMSLCLQNLPRSVSFIEREDSECLPVNFDVGAAFPNRRASTVKAWKRCFLTRLQTCQPLYFPPFFPSFFLLVAPLSVLLVAPVSVLLVAPVSVLLVAPVSVLLVAPVSVLLVAPVSALLVAPVSVLLVAPVSVQLEVKFYYNCKIEQSTGHV